MNQGWLIVTLSAVVGCALPNDYSRIGGTTSSGGHSSTSVNQGGTTTTLAGSSGQSPIGASTSNAGSTSVEGGASNTGSGVTGIPLGGGVTGTPLGGSLNGGSPGTSAGVGGSSTGIFPAGGTGMATSIHAGGYSTATGGAMTGGVATGGMVTGGSISVGGTAVAGNSSVSSCPTASLPAPIMKPMPNGYCIDSTEVTRAQYQAWLDTGPNPLTFGQNPTACGWNQSFGPDETCMTVNPVCTQNCGNHPVICIDWCDAFAYCKAVGRRLCGSIQGDANAFGNFASEAASQWYAACSSGGRHPYPYGNTYEPSYCQSPTDSASTASSEVMVHGSCHSNEPGYKEVYDLSGNVWEWEDSCSDDTQNALCRLRGGSFMYYGNGPTENADYASCTHGGQNFRTYVQYTVGFRCCT